MSELDQAAVEAAMYAWLKGKGLNYEPSSDFNAWDYGDMESAIRAYQTAMAPQVREAVIANEHAAQDVTIADSGAERNGAVARWMESHRSLLALVGASEETK